VVETRRRPLLLRQLAFIECVVYSSRMLDERQTEGGSGEHKARSGLGQDSDGNSNSNSKNRPKEKRILNTSMSLAISQLE